MNATLNNECTGATRLDVVVPYRNREQFLSRFLQSFPGFLRGNYNSHWHIWIAEQKDEKKFNLGSLVNAAFDTIRMRPEWSACDSLLMQSVDCLPVVANYNIDSEVVLFCDHRYSDHYFKAAKFRNSFFEAINGYDNRYWGWGAEDDDIMVRIDTVLPGGVKRQSVEFADAECFRLGPPNDDVYPAAEIHQLLADCRAHCDPSVNGLGTVKYKLVGKKRLSEGVTLLEIEL